MKFNLYDVFVYVSNRRRLLVRPSANTNVKQTNKHQISIYLLEWRVFLTNITQNGKKKKEKELIQFDKTTSSWNIYLSSRVTTTKKIFLIKFFFLLLYTQNWFCSSSPPLSSSSQYWLTLFLFLLFLLNWPFTTNK